MLPSLTVMFYRLPNLTSNLQGILLFSISNCRIEPIVQLNFFFISLLIMIAYQTNHYQFGETFFRKEIGTVSLPPWTYCHSFFRVFIHSKSKSFYFKQVLWHSLNVTLITIVVLLPRLVCSLHRLPTTPTGWKWSGDIPYSQFVTTQTL